VIRFASLGSGSEGNGLLVECGFCRVLVDCGFSLAETRQRLARLGLQPESLTAILVTHEHSDHISGVARLARSAGMPVYGSYGTLSFLRAELDDALLNEIETDAPFDLQALRVEPFAVPHDSREPLQFVLGDGARRLGVLTDVGRSTPHIEAMLDHCDALFLETNHDRVMLMNGPYPPQLKERVAGRFGHLSNDEAAQLLSRLDHSQLQHVVAAHISRKNNRPGLAQSALAAVLGCEPGDIGVADQSEGLPWRTIA
jgi:phosphoribosyl 1,2-cyclic phosphodiesterase